MGATTAGAALRGDGQVGGDRRELAARARRARDVDAVGELLEREPALGGGVAQELDGALSLGV